jgi:hypothetical protein
MQNKQTRAQKRRRRAKWGRRQGREGFPDAALSRNKCRNDLGPEDCIPFFPLVGLLHLKMNGKKHNKGGATANKVGNNIRRKAGEAENAEFSRFHKAQIKPIRSVDFKANCCVPRFSKR